MEWRLLRTLQTLELSPTLTERAVIAASNTIKPWVFLIKAKEGKCQIFVGFEEQDAPIIVPAFSMYKQVSLEEESIYPPIDPLTMNSYYVMVQKTHFGYPLFNMYRDMYEEIDPLGTLLNTASEISKVAGSLFVWVGIKGLSKKEDAKVKKEMYKLTLSLKKKSAKGHLVINTPSELNANLNLKYSRGEMNTENDIERKRNQTLFDVTFLVGAKKEVYERHIEAMFSVMKHQNQLVPVKIGKDEAVKITESVIARNGLFKKRSNILGHSELASLVHPPSIAASVPTFQHTGFKTLEIPFELPKGKNIIGYAVGASGQHPVSLTKEILDRNCIAIGNSGFGKSTVAIKSFIEGIKLVPDATFIFYDPHGDASKVLIKNIPEDRIKDVVLLDAADIEYPFSYNMMDTTDIVSGSKYKKSSVSDELFYFDPERFDKLTPVVGQLVDVMRIISIAQLGNSKDAYAFGPRAADIMTRMFGFFMSSVYIGKKFPQFFGSPVFTMGDAIKFLVDEKIRNKVIARTVFPLSKPDYAHYSREMKEYWEHTFPEVILGYSRQKADTLSAVTNKIRNAIPPRMLKVSCQILPKFKMSRFLKPGKIIIIRVPESIGSIEAQTLISSSLLSDVHFELVRRSETNEDRTDTYIFIDEADTISQAIINKLLNKDRKFGAHLFINFQNLKQVGEETRDAILTSVNTLFVFRTSGIDGTIMEEEFDREFLRASDFTSTSKHYAYARIPINGRITPPFVFKTVPLPEGSEETARKVIDNSRRLISKPASSVHISFLDLITKELLSFERKKNTAEEISNAVKSMEKNKNNPFMGPRKRF